MDMRATQQPQEVIPMDQLAKTYLKIRAAMQKALHDYEAQKAFLEDQRNIISNAIKEQMKAAGNLQSVKTAEGTVYLTTKIRFQTDDWDSFKQFVKEHDALDLYEHRIAQRNMAKFLEDHPGVVPAGLNSNSEIVVSVRKS